MKHEDTHNGDLDALMGDLKAKFEIPVEALPEVPEPVQVDPLASRGLKIIKWNDQEAHMKLASKIRHVRVFWPDHAKIDPLRWYCTIFAQPTNIVFDVHDGAGVIAYANVQPKRSAQVYVAMWDRAALRIPIETLRFTGIVAIQAHDLIVIESYVNSSNTLSQRITEKAGLKRKGILKDLICYNEVPEDVIWYEGHKNDIGLD